MNKKEKLFTDFLMGEPRIKLFMSEEKENLVKEMKKMLLEDEKIKCILEKNEKIEILKSINIKFTMETELTNALEAAFGSTILAVNPLLKPLAKQLNTNNIILKLNKESKCFFIEFSYTLNDSKSLEISSSDANLVIDKYASIIYEEKLKYNKQLEEEERQKKENERKKIEEEQKLKEKQEEEKRIVEKEKLRKEKEFNDFFEM